MPADQALPATNSYRQYKDATDRYLTWLMRTARDCGYEYIPPKASKPATDAGGVAITIANGDLLVNEILEQTRLVCRSPSLRHRAPPAVMRVGRRAVKLRNIVAARHVSTTDQATQRANATHAFFTNVLTQSLGMSEEHYIKVAENEIKRKLDPKSTVEPVAQADDRLDVDDTNETHETVDQREQSSSFLDDADTVPEIDIEVDAKDVWMLINCFFEDVHAIRDHVLTLWNHVVNGTCDHVSASLTTTAAVALVEELERELVEALESDKSTSKNTVPGLCAIETAYSALTANAFKAMHGDMTHDPAFALKPEGRLWFYDIALLLHKFAFGIQITYGKDGDATLGKAEDTQAWDFWPRIPTVDVMFWLRCPPAQTCMTQSAFVDLQQTDMFLSPLLTSTFIKRCELLFVHDITQWSKRAGVADRATFAVINAAEGKISVGDVFIWEILWQLHLQIGVQSEPLMDSTSGKSTFATDTLNAGLLSHTASFFKTR